MRRMSGIILLVLVMSFSLCCYLSMQGQGLAQPGDASMVYAGNWDDLQGGVTPFPDDKFIIFSDPAGLYAVSMVCTHLGCDLPFRQDLNTFMCPCHGSSFDRSGIVLSGPAEKNLPCYFIKITEDGKVWVDTSHVVERGAKFKKPEPPPKPESESGQSEK